MNRGLYLLGHRFSISSLVSSAQAQPNPTRGNYFDELAVAVALAMMAIQLRRSVADYSRAHYMSTAQTIRTARGTCGCAAELGLHCAFVRVVWWC
jgi:hypothetical protein